MVHSFTVATKANGNAVIEFLEDNKRRQIIFTKNTQAYWDFAEVSGLEPIDAVNQLRKKYIFKANTNNKSIFRPVDKSLILN